MLVRSPYNLFLFQYTYQLNRLLFNAYQFTCHNRARDSVFPRICSEKRVTAWTNIKSSCYKLNSIVEGTYILGFIWKSLSSRSGHFWVISKTVFKTVEEAREQRTYLMYLICRKPKLLRKARSVTLGGGGGGGYALPYERGGNALK